MVAAETVTRCNVSKSILHVPLNNVSRGEGMLQEMRDFCAMKHASADAMLHVLVHERGTV
jgi:hypothetical protein